MDEQPTPSQADAGAGTIFTAHRITQALVTIASAACFVLFWYGGQWVGIPWQPGYQVSLLGQPSWPIAILATYLMFGIAVVIGSLIAGRSWFFAGLFAAAIGLMALSARGGPMHDVVLDAAGHGTANQIFRRLAVEQCLLFLVIAPLWMLTSAWFFVSAAAASKPSPPRQETEPAGAAVTAVLAQIGMLSVVILLQMSASDAKKQVLVSLFIGALGATALAEHFFRSNLAAPWYWVGPCVVGLIGYLLAYFSGQPTIGQPPGIFAALARPLPLDYASAAVAGSVLGYWIGRERPAVASSLLGGIATRGIWPGRIPPGPPADADADGRADAAKNP